MTHVDIYYTDPSKTRAELDAKAVKDMREYLTPKQWEAMIDAVGLINADGLSVEGLNFLFGMVGVRGRPFHAFCRKYLLNQYRTWMQSGKDAQVVDSEGFVIEQATETKAETAS